MSADTIQQRTNNPITKTPKVPSESFKLLTEVQMPPPNASLSASNPRISMLPIDVWSATALPNLAVNDVAGAAWG
jgi:hypothetical protein